jgi:hypothetical protein
VWAAATVVLWGGTVRVDAQGPTLPACGVAAYDGAVRDCRTLQLVSASGACANPDGPQMVETFNITREGVPAPTSASASTPQSSSVMIRAMNGSWLGGGEVRFLLPTCISHLHSLTSTHPLNHPHAHQPSRSLIAPCQLH